MKKTDLEKNKGLKLREQLRGAPPNRFAAGAATAAVAPDRRAQRKLDQEQGLIPFSVKIKQSLVEEIKAQAQEQDVPLNELVTALLEKGLGR